VLWGYTIYSDLSKGTLVHENEYDEETFGKRKYVEM
jgi:hypothetical protein